jgi:hypothetical protein
VQVLHELLASRVFMVLIKEFQVTFLIKHEGKLPKFLMDLAHEEVKPNPYPWGVQKLSKEKWPSSGLLTSKELKSWTLGSFSHVRSEHLPQTIVRTWVFFHL